MGNGFVRKPESLEQVLTYLKEGYHFGGCPESKGVYDYCECVGKLAELGLRFLGGEDPNTSHRVAARHGG